MFNKVEMLYRGLVRLYSLCGFLVVVLFLHDMFLYNLSVSLLSFIPVLPISFSPVVLLSTVYWSITACSPSGIQHRKLI